VFSKRDFEVFPVYGSDPCLIAVAECFIEAEVGSVLDSVANALFALLGHEVPVPELPVLVPRLPAHAPALPAEQELRVLAAGGTEHPLELVETEQALALSAQLPLAHPTPPLRVQLIEHLAEAEVGSQSQLDAASFLLAFEE